MGDKLIDQFSYLHLSTGLIAYFLKIRFIDWFYLHLFFEIVENTPEIIWFVDNYITFWPGGKKGPDELHNSITDQIFAMTGWYLGKFLDEFYSK